MRTAIRIAAAALLGLALARCCLGQAFTFNDPPFYAQQAAQLLDPRTIPNLSIWLKSDTGTTFDANNRLTNWADQSGNGYKFTNQNAASATCCASNGVALNGHTTLYFFSGSANASYSMVSTGAENRVSCFEVFKWDQTASTNNGKHFPFWLGSKSTGASAIGGDLASCAFFAQRDQAPGSGTNPTELGDQNNTALTERSNYNAQVWHYFSVRANAINTASTNWSCNIDGGTNALASLTSGNFGIQWWIGSPQSQASSPLFGNIAEVLVYSRWLSEVELTNVNTYLKTKYGL